MPRKVARSRAVHSHSRFCSTDIGPDVPKVSLLRVVSIWHTLMRLFRSTSPIRQLLEWSSLAWRPMKLRLCGIAFTLGLWCRDRYEERPVAVYCHPPSIYTRLLFTYKIR